MTKESEIRILESCANGDAAAFEPIVHKYQSLVCAITYSAVGQVEKSEELAQQVFINAWKGLGTLKDLANFKAWLVGITRNVIRDWFRHQKRDIVAKAASIDEIGEAADESSEPLEAIITKEQEAIVQQSLQQIPEKYREPMVLFYRQQQSTRQVAEALEISEETVRTRLMRGRQMLKDQVARMVESTLAHTGPGKAFTTMVVASIAGLALTSATAEAATGTTTATGTSTVASSAGSSGLAALTTGITAKIITAAAVVAVGVGAIFAYKYLTRTDQPQSKSIKPTSSRPDNLVAVFKPTQSDKPVVAVTETADPLAPVAPQAKNTTTPTDKETIKCIHAYLKERSEEIEIWIKGDNKWRFSIGDGERICDGKRILTLDHRNKQASYSRGPLKQPEEILNSLMIAEFVYKNFDPAKEEAKINYMGKSCIIRQNPDIESEPGEVIFDAFEVNSNELLGTAWIDKQTGQLNYLEASESQGGFTGEWHYEPIDDNVFLTQVPKGYVIEQGRYIDGIVTDVDSNPITDATIYVTGLFEGPDQEIVTKTNNDGYFKYGLKFERENWGIEFPVVIRAVSPSYPDMVGWTCILDPDVEVEKWPSWMPPIDSEVVVTKYEPKPKRVICKSIQNLWLQLEPAGFISGSVTNKQGEPIQDAAVNAAMHLRFQVNKQRSGEVFTNRFAISAQTDETGYYNIVGVPALHGDALAGNNEFKNCSVYASASGYFRKSQYIKNAQGGTNIDLIEEKYCDFVLSKNDLIIKGRVVDNYGNPLAYYEGVDYKEEGSNLLHSSGRLDGQGKFVIPNAPRADTIFITKDTYEDSYNWLRDSETKNLEFVAYAKKKFEFSVPPDVNVLDVGDLVMDYPDITAEIYVVDFEGNPVGFVECFPESIGSEELLKDRYWKVTDEKKGRCIINNLPRVDSVNGRVFRPIVLRPYGKTPKKYRKMFEQYRSLTYYHPQYPGDYNHYIFELVLPRNNHPQDYRIRIYSPEGELLLEEDFG